MANSIYLAQTVEPFIVDWVSRRIGIALHLGRVVVGPRMDGTPVHFAFDGVSEDGRAGLLVSTNLTVKPGGTRKRFMDASILFNAPFQHRLMAFINDDVKDNFMNQCDGLIPLKEIQILVCNSLPAVMQDEIATFQAAAKSEVGDEGKKSKLGGKRK
jgi:hypothetical protein